MADSRSSLQAPADLSIPGQILPPEQPETTPETGSETSLVKSSHRYWDEARGRMIMGQLLFAARDLAERQFNRPVRGLLARRGPDGAWQLMCVECRTSQADEEKRLDHQAWCRTGRVQKLIDALFEMSAAADEKAVNECLTLVKGGRQ